MTVDVVTPAEMNNSGATAIATGVVSTKLLRTFPEVPPAETLSGVNVIRLKYCLPLSSGLNA